MMSVTRQMGHVDSDFMIDERNELAKASPGDKSYQVPEYSVDFYKLGSTRPLARYGPACSFRSPDTFIPLRNFTINHRESFREREKRRRYQEEMDTVQQLETWRPSTPLPLTLPVLDDLNNVKLPQMEEGKNKSRNAAARCHQTVFK